MQKIFPFLAKAFPLQLDSIVRRLSVLLHSSGAEPLERRLCLPVHGSSFVLFEYALVLLLLLLLCLILLPSQRLLRSVLEGDRAGQWVPKCLQSSVLHLACFAFSEGFC